MPVPDSAVTWFGRMSLLHRPGVWIPGLVLLGVGAYHLAWAAGDSPYNGEALATVAACALGALGTLALLGAGLVRVGTCVRAALALIGFAGAVLGVDLIAGPARVGTPTTTAVVGALTLMAGITVFSAGVYLRTDLDRPSSLGAPPRHLAQEEVRLDGAAGLLRRFREFGRGTDRLVDACRPQLAVEDLHYVSYHVDGECRFSLDVLEDPRLDRFLDQVSPDGRREHYLQHARYLDRLMVGLNASFEEIDAGVLIRVVLDVERGALYYYWIDDRRFVVGVTLDQEMVDTADRKMVRIVDALRASLGHRRISDLERRPEKTR